MEKIVTKDWLRNKLIESFWPFNCKPNASVVVGRALVAIYRRQTNEEQAAFATKNKNGVGFSGPDAVLGSKGAKAFLATGALPPWLVRVWLVEKSGYPRICKYAKQLNEIANEKKACQASLLPV